MDGQDHSSCWGHDGLGKIVAHLSHDGLGKIVAHLSHDGWTSKLLILES